MGTIVLLSPSGGGMGGVRCGAGGSEDRKEGVSEMVEVMVEIS